MWHWNSFWARAPGDPPTLVDPQLWQTPWAPDNFFTLQARGWETMLGAAQSWWGMFMPASPLLSAWAPADAAATAASLTAAAEEATPARARRPAAATKRRKATSSRGNRSARANAT